MGSHRLSDLQSIWLVMSGVVTDHMDIVLEADLLTRRYRFSQTFFVGFKQEK